MFAAANNISERYMRFFQWLENEVWRKRSNIQGLQSFSSLMTKSCILLRAPKEKYQTTYLDIQIKYLPYY
jgi:hypothetical protein